MRKSGLEKNGEFSTENLTYKILRNEGLLEKPRNKITELKDKGLSL